jgi:NDP-sugar pyrophosphorylase family protein
VTSPRLRAVVLAAGLGTRLRPLTAGIPKPLLPVLGRPLIAWTLERLEAAGVEAAAINLHYRGDAIAAALGDRFGAMPLVYSREPEILGTLGALAPLRDFLASAELVLLVNGDSLCRWPFEVLVAEHLRRSRGDSPPMATLLVANSVDPAAFGGGVAVDREGRIHTLLPGSRSRAEDRARTDGTTRHVFLGAHVFSPSLAERARPTFSDIVRDLYEPSLAAGAAIAALQSDAPWHDVGTAARYLDAVLDWAARENPSRPRDAAVIEAGATLEDDVVALRTLVLAGARIGRGSRLDRVVVGPGVEIAAGSSLAGELVTPRSWGTAGAGARDDGTAVHAPLEPASVMS